ncbi:hypothetical protein [Geomesophilobacter sediminis]|uniref:Lipoprotein n=1 Tax=Geomesophilobacter sediminis TaxID=2798584 RepID=A0A8J7IQZ3_9BACT|nr:hypothetical protein [Geomesophilobacter sediminis]MBJ6725179.1 hypothetical protein [Geomesophilobacter sediminis]
MSKRFALLIVALSFLAACAGTQTRHDTNPAYSQHQYKSHDIDIAWKADKTDQGLRLTGTISNPHYETTYQAFELTVSLLDDSGKTIGQKIFSTDPGYFAGSQPLVLDIPIAPSAQVRQVNFNYSYAIGDDHFTGNFKSLP